MSRVDRPPAEKRLYKDKLYKIQHGRCCDCNKVIPKTQMTFDHIVPYSKGGGSSLRNLQLMCKSCNEAKADACTGKLRPVLKHER